MTKCSKKGQIFDVVSRVILSQIFLNVLNWPKKCDEQFYLLFYSFILDLVQVLKLNHFSDIMNSLTSNGI